MNIRVKKYQLTFNRPSGTSRGVLTHKKSWIIFSLDATNSVIAKGECSIIEGLSPDFQSDKQYEEKIHHFIQLLNANTIQSLEQLYKSILMHELFHYPSILNGIEQFLLNLDQHDKNLFYKNDFSTRNIKIPINGLIWMGDKAFMQQQIEEKLKAGFTCLKMKVGAIDFDTELEILQSIRKRFSKNELVLRVDANGAFSPKDALKKLELLSKLDIHSIEQPIQVGQWETMKDLCHSTPLPIALDEELIQVSNKDELLDVIKPQYIILKPSLHGGFYGSNEWIEKANKRSIPWWITSALESNIGLNAIAQFTGNFPIQTHHGLGTGALYQQNFKSKLHIQNGELEMLENFVNFGIDDDLS